MKVGDKIQIDVSGTHDCGSLFFYSGKATVLPPLNGRDAFLLVKPVRCVNCGVKIEVYRAVPDFNEFPKEQDVQNLSPVWVVSWK